jgi:type III secretion system FlhB-like substrate exporter
MSTGDATHGGEPRPAAVTLRDDEALATALAGLELDAVVPPALFAALAEVIAWAHRQEARHAA